jgi:hypothetical protein
MSQELSYQLENEVKAILHHHLSRVAEFTTSVDPNAITLCDTLREDLAMLERICWIPSCHVSRETYSAARQLLDRIRNLFQLINPSFNSTMTENSELGNLWTRANDWCNRLDTAYDIQDEEVWDIIAPVVPDVLNRLRHNFYEAIWWKPIPCMDIEILRRTEYVVMEYCAPESMVRTGLMRVRFSIQR